MRKKHFCVSLALLSFCGKSIGQEDSIQTILIKEVEVEGYRSITAQTPMQKLNHEELERIGGGSLSEAVQHLSGVQITDYGGISGWKTIKVRSAETGNVNLFYDGIELDNIQSGGVDLGRFSIDNLEGVSICNGHEPFLLQPAKSFLSAASVSLSTRTPTFMGNKTDNMRVKVRGGSSSTIIPSLLWEHRWSRKIKSSFNAEYINSTGEYVYHYKTIQGYDTSATRHNADLKSFRVEGNVFGEMAEGDWKIKASFYHSERGVPGAITKDASVKQEINDRQNDNDLRLQGSFRKHFSDLYWLQIGAKYSLERMHYITDQVSQWGPYTADDRYKMHDTYLSASHLFHITEQWNVALANDFQWNLLHTSTAGFPNVGRITSYNSVSTSLSLGILRLQGSLLQTYANTSTNDASLSSQSKNEWSPTLSFRLVPVQGTPFYIRGFYKYGFKMPTLNDLYYPNYGNKDLKPEHNHHYNLGFSYFLSPKELWLPRCELQADGYLSEVKEKIISAPTSDPTYWLPQNVAKVHIVGLSASSRFNWGTEQLGFSLRLNYSYQKAEDRTPNVAGYGGQVAYIPFHNASATAEINYRGWILGWHSIFTGKRYTSSENTTENEMESYGIHNLTLSGSMPVGKVKMKVGLGVNNLLNRSYEVYSGYPMPERNFSMYVSVLL